MSVDEGVVGVFNTSEDTVELLRDVLETAGFTVVTAFTYQLRDGRANLEDLMREFRPKVVVYDIALPYQENWRLFENIRSSPACRNVRFVITTTNVSWVRGIVGTAEPMIELVGKPYDLDEIVGAVRREMAAGASPH